MQKLSSTNQERARERGRERGNALELRQRVYVEEGSDLRDVSREAHEDLTGCLMRKRGQELVMARGSR